MRQVLRQTSPSGLDLGGGCRVRLCKTLLLKMSRICTRINNNSQTNALALSLAMKQRFETEAWSNNSENGLLNSLPPPPPSFYTTPYFSLSPTWHILPSPPFVCFQYPRWRLHARNAQGSLTRKMRPLFRLNIHALLSTLCCCAIALVLAHSTVHFFSQDMAVVLLLLWPQLFKHRKALSPG